MIGLQVKELLKQMKACCRPVSYVPSAFEKEWGEHAAKNTEDACSFIKSNAPKVDKWLAALKVRAFFVCAPSCRLAAYSPHFLRCLPWT